MADQYVYESRSIAEKAYLTRSGYIDIELNQYDHFRMKGSVIFFGVPELLIGEQKGFCLRLFNVKAKQYETIAFERLVQYLKAYSTGFVICKTIAIILTQVDRLIVNKKQKLGEKEYQSQEYCKLLTWVIDSIGEQYKENSYSWLKDIYELGITRLTYEKGKVLNKLEQIIGLDIHAEELDEFNNVYPKGSFICKEGEEVQEMFIIKQGKVKVVINGNFIGIREKGSIIGEMALFLGEGTKRTASLQALEETVVSRIKKNDLKLVLEKSPPFFKQIAFTLSKRLEQQCLVLNELNQLIEEKQADNASGNSLDNPHKTEVQDLKNEIDELFQVYHDMDWLGKLAQEMADKITTLEHKAML